MSDGERILLTLEWQHQDLEGGGCLDSCHSLEQESVPNLTVPFGFQLNFSSHTDMEADKNAGIWKVQS